jgi:aromatic-L-amino-acid/L-tryptophan decarboxylase
MTDCRQAPIEIGREEFRSMGYQLIDRIAEFIDTIDQKPVTTSEPTKQLQNILGASSLPEKGMPAREILTRASDLLLNYSLLNGHPRFLGYITSSPAPIGALADLLAATVNPNVGAQVLSPMATEIERQTIKWLAEFIGYSAACGGLLVSGGNMANVTAFLTARTIKLSRSTKETGLLNVLEKPVVYCSKATHTWIEKAAALSGLGSQSIRWIEINAANQIDRDVLESTIQSDLRNGLKPIMVIGTAGDVSTGAVDDLLSLSSICKVYDLWFHIDGAYGMPAAVVPEQQDLFAGLKEADSIALDPHKWLYSPLEAGCTLVKNPKHLIQTYSSHPEYYNFGKSNEETVVNFYECGLQNSRGFRALKVWMALQQVGREGYIKMIREDIELSKYFFAQANHHPELEAVTQNLSITTLRYVPVDFENDSEGKEMYLNTLNEVLLNQLQRGGEVFLSNAVVNGKYCLRGCIVNFRTSKKDIEAIVDIIVREGKRVHKKLQEKIKIL